MTEPATSIGAGFRAAFRTDPGRVRANNEDLPLIDPERGVCGVVDGIGGQAAGEVAAAIARDVILQRLARPLGTPAERVREAIAIANNEIFRRAAESAELHGMTCVVTLALVTDRTLTIGHVGDSRLYKLRAGGIRKLTRDHSPVGEREDAQEISEADAMRHPRRHEVFRDVGSAYRDKDEDDYVDVIQDSIEPDSAILVCTDGLTDMLPSASIAQIVAQHAGDPDAVVTALIEAANDAGGRDNITAVYVEGPEFAGAIRTVAADTGHSRQTGAIGSIGRWVVRSRTTWFAIGALSGALAALLLVWRIPATIAIGTRTLVVGAEGAGGYPRIADALRAARAGDTVRVEPGIYTERVLVPDGVNLVARVPSSVTLARAADVAGEWVAVTALGELGGHISGIRIESTHELPVDVGIRVAGQGHTIELAEIAGPMRSGVEVLPGAGLTVHGSHFVVQGPAVTTAARSQALVTRNVFIRAGRAPVAPLALGPFGQMTIRGNLFAGYSGEIVRGMSASDRQQIAAANVIVSAEPAPVR